MLDIIFQNYLPHKHCFLGNQFILAGFIVTNLLIAYSYFHIPILLAGLLRYFMPGAIRDYLLRSIPYIFLCGVTHIMSVIVLFKGLYVLSVVLLSFTAIVSVYTALKLQASYYPILKGLIEIQEYAKELKQ